MNTTELVVEIRPEKNSGPYGICTHDLCDTGAKVVGANPVRAWIIFRSYNHTSSVVLIAARIYYIRYQNFI